MHTLLPQNGALFASLFDGNETADVVPHGNGAPSRVPFLFSCSAKVNFACAKVSAARKRLYAALPMLSYSMVMKRQMSSRMAMAALRAASW